MKPILAKIFGYGTEKKEDDEDVLILDFLRGDGNGIVLGIYVGTNGNLGALDVSHFYVPDTKHVFLEEDD